MNLEERLAEALDKANTELRLLKENQFDMMVAAYKRGANWRDEIGDLELVDKAAYDYADYRTPVTAQPAVGL